MCCFHPHLLAYDIRWESSVALLLKSCIVSQLSALWHPQMLPEKSCKGSWAKNLGTGPAYDRSGEENLLKLLRLSPYFPNPMVSGLFSVTLNEKDIRILPPSSIQIYIYCLHSPSFFSFPISFRNNILWNNEWFLIKPYPLGYLSAVCWSQFAAFPHVCLETGISTSHTWLTFGRLLGLVVKKQTCCYNSYCFRCVFNIWWIATLGKEKIAFSYASLLIFVGFAGAIFQYVQFGGKRAIPL